jgi:hypothetical protein
LIAGGLRRGSTECSHHQKEQQWRSDGFTHAYTPLGAHAFARSF